MENGGGQRKLMRTKPLLSFVPAVFYKVISSVLSLIDAVA